ncbi:hypothetical protein [Methanobrevibacter arboriphilus]|uniref:Uncharacterized protein n=1 Tax=Methanobrevibacter arboriphilus TaxID=39441 RepID=A0ACA8R5Q5_METAZ|nr:hypothetical protein [Methanobrevibacter arboriphilus]BBL62369.1 hypothetical protein MarbSA_14090 [Methanobrevibacter arboriphilus]
MNEETYPLLEITEKGTYNLYTEKDVKVIPESTEGFKKIVENKELIVKFIFESHSKVKIEVNKLKELPVKI